MTLRSMKRTSTKYSLHIIFSSNLSSQTPPPKKTNYAEMKDAYPPNKEGDVCHLACLILGPTRAPHIFGAHEKDEPVTAAHFLTIKALQRKKRKAQTLESYPHEYLPGFFFFFPFFSCLYPPVDSLSDSYKTHPSLASIRLSLNWLQITSMTLSSRLRAYNI